MEELKEITAQQAYMMSTTRLEAKIILAVQDVFKKVKEASSQGKFVINISTYNDREYYEALENELLSLGYSCRRSENYVCLILSWRNIP